MARKNSKAAVAETVSAIVESFKSAAAKHENAVQTLDALDVSKMGEHEAKQHKAARLAEINRMMRANHFADLMGNEAFAAAFLQFSLTADSVMRLQIYAQDKLAATLRAIAADCALSAIRAGNHSNMMTQRLVAVLDKDGSTTVANAPRRMHDLFNDKSMGTYSAQASSSRQVLELLGMIEFDTLTKAFKLSEQGESFRKVIAH